jgi:tetratricopeptide (TPR) repeat protein/pimeloyl-ACP methyl ester carboxylesterase
MKPLVVLVPDLFGSHLRDGAGRVWVDDEALEAGGLGRLAIDKPHVAPDGVIAATYRTLVEALESIYDVNAFDYDWRQPLAAAAEAVRQVVADALKQEDRQVHLLGHGWGGVVAAAAAADGDLLPLLAQRHCRVVTLGAPFTGSWEIQRMLDGSHPLARLLAGIVTQRTAVESVSSILAAWPGLTGARPDRKAEIPADLLPLLTTIAGTGTPTCVGRLPKDTGTPSAYLFHADGDGIVAARDALVAGARGITLEGSHVQLITAPQAIKICFEELAAGPSPHPRALARPADEPLEAREEPLPEVITSVELIEAATGALSPVTLVYPLTVSVLHSHLRQADHPVAIGHYRDDTIVSAEAALDVALGGRLSRRLDLDVYAGSAGAVEVLSVPGAHPPGAIVIGLGEVGDLTPEKLARLVANAAVRHAVRVADASGGPGWASAAMSTLLIGTDSGSITLADSIRSIVRGVLEANRRLRATRLWERVRVDRLQFVELFEDVAEQAAHVINSLPDALAQELTRAEGIRPVPQLSASPGGEYSRPPEDFRAQGWWRRVQVSARTPAQQSGGNGGATDALELVYTPLTDRAKLSQSTAVQSLPQVAKLVEASMLQSAVDLKLSNALFELLVPGSLKHSIRNGGDVLLLLNSAAARYPFELMADRESMAEPVPLIKKCGILRQLELREQPRKLDITSGRDVLVIGPPLAPAWPTLPGAREEAHRIADLCRDRGYRPTLVVNANSRDVQTEVFASDARVLHIAAHGQYSDNPFESGVVIGDHEFFTTANVAAMRRVPEFVFLNCCHLGRLGPDTKPATAFPALAASLAEGFMSAGVRAVIAAGWTVDDAAGLKFARTFYEQFLGGELFGEAVRRARLETLAQHPATSTWGAFQCYGSPEYRLRSTASSERPHFSKPPVSRGELIARVRSLAERAGGARGAELTSLAREFETQKRLIFDSDRWQDGETLAALANFAAQLELFQDAIELYRQALNVAKGLAPLQAVEQLANMLGREAPRLAVTKDTDAAAKAIKLFEEAIGWLNWLDEKLKPPTAERLALRGSVHKRWAMLTREKERRSHLRDAWQAYGDARAQARGKQSYQLLNWLALGFLLKKQSRQELLGLARSELTLAQQKNDSPGDRSFWDRVAVPDALLHVALFEGSLTDPGVVDDIDAAYVDALATGPSARERASARDHLVFLAEMLPDPSLKLKLDVPSGALQQLIKRLH